MDAAFAEPLVLVASSPTLVNGTVPRLDNPTISGLENALPSNVMLVTLKPVPGTNKSNSNNKWMVRLGHQYSVGEHPVWSQPATVHWATLFSDWDIVQVVEMSLTGTRKLSESRRLQWLNTKEAVKNQRRKSMKDNNDGGVELHPMEVRTFEVTVKARAQYEILNAETE